MKLVTLVPIRRKDWIIKASVLDDQLLIFLWNECTMEAVVRIFYCEVKAHEFIERICDDDTDC